MIFNTYYQFSTSCVLDSGLTDEQKIEIAKEHAVKDIARQLVNSGQFELDGNNIVRGIIKIGE